MKGHTFACEEIDAYKREPIFNEQQELHPLAQFRRVQDYARRANVSLTGYGTGEKFIKRKSLRGVLGQVWCPTVLLPSRSPRGSPERLGKSCSAGPFNGAST